MKTKTFLLCLGLALASLASRAGEPGVTLQNFKLTGDLGGDVAGFTLTANAKVENSRGAMVELLSGTVALTGIGPHSKWNIQSQDGRFYLVFDRAGTFPIQVKFNAAIRTSNDWSAVDFHIAPGTVQPVVLQGLAADTEFQFTDAARPERSGNDFISYLPVDGDVKFSWKQARPEAEGKLFYAAEMLSQISVGPGLMRQTALIDGKVMQGEMNRVAMVLHGTGEVTRVLGDTVLSWNIEAITNSTDRRLVVQFNQPQKDQFTVQVQLQTPLDAFPQTTDVVQVKPEGATRFSGSFRIMNDGAVRLEIVRANGLSQISPEQFPDSTVFHLTGNQRFAYRFSSADFALRVQAEQILPEVTVSQVLAYNLGENEQAIDAELELDIREAPLRELVLDIPRGYAIAKLNAPGMNDYFVNETSASAEPDRSELRIVYGQPVSDRQVIQLRLERNQALKETNWPLPRIDVAKAKSVRGFVGISADSGLRLTPDHTQSLTEIATAFFPRPVTGLQSAFRLGESNWKAAVRVERLAQTVQADAFHLFSIGEGIAYGSSVINYVISGAPVSTFRVELSDEYFNVEFTGKDIRNWEKTPTGYLVQLHTPVSGAYTLLATYERPFKAQGETLTFTGARPLDAQSESGHTLVTSAYQFQVKPVNVSPGLLPLETGEVPAEYRLFFDAPVLAAYRYSSRPFNLNLALSPLAQGDSLSQVVDRAALTTRISKEGQVLTDVRYFVKNRGNPHFRLTLPEGTQLWSATVNDVAVVPVMDGKSNLIPLPQSTDPDAVLTIQLKLASRSSSAGRVTVGAPIVSAPVMLAEWKLDPDEGRRLVFERGSLTPVGGVPDVSGFAQLGRLFHDEPTRLLTLIFAVVVLILSTLVTWRWAGREEVHRFSVRHLVGGIIGLGWLVLVAPLGLNLVNMAGNAGSSLPREISFVAPVQQAENALSIQVGNLPENASAMGFLNATWPFAFAIAAWIYGRTRADRATRTAGWILGWTLLAWATLRLPNAMPAFLLVIAGSIVFYAIVPALKRFWLLPMAQNHAPATGGAPAVATLLTVLLWLGGVVNGSSAGLPESVVQQIRVEDTFAMATAKIHWHAEKGDMLPLLSEPAVLTHINCPRSLKLEDATDGSFRIQQLVAQSGGTFDIELQYQLQVRKGEAENGFVLPVPSGLVNKVTVTMVNLYVDVYSPQAVSVQREPGTTNTVATLVLSPGTTRIGWKPRSRDVKSEKPVYYAEISQLYVPSAGVVEGVHQVSIRPAQGELSELILDVPAGSTITDVIDPGLSKHHGDSMVQLWRFDPDTRKLRVTLNPAQSKPFALVVRSQVATGTLPFEQPVGLLSVNGAAGQIGLLGIATGNDVQLDNVAAGNFSAINLEDFPTGTAQGLAGQFPGLTVRRAFRYSDIHATASIKASAVEPDVRVETQDTVSLGEDRTVLASTAAVTITRAGIFRLSFVMPAGFDVESISGATLSHWTELKTAAERIITLNLNGKTEGEQQFMISLSGPGVKTVNGWRVPQLILREAGKQRGSLVIAPEQGMRLQVATREGVTQLDPQKSGIHDKGVLAFRVLQTPWNLALDIEQVDPWIQVTSLQHATVNEAQVKVAANLEYQIENTGLKAFRVRVPAGAEGVTFRGDQVADYLPVDGATTNGLREWEVKLHRRVIGQYLLQLNYQVLLGDQAAQTVLRGVQAADVNLQRGFVTIQSAGRLQMRVDNLPSSLQTVEWQSIPRPLLKDLETASANAAYRLVEPDFQLPLKLERHDAAKLLPAHINNVLFTSVISDAGTMLTHARLDILPGDKRLLHLTLPKDAKFWFAFVNQNGVWPWREQDQILIPLEQQSRNDQPVPVEVFFSSQVGSAGASALDLKLLAPKFDLPLENITWRVFLNDKWQVKKWSGTLQLQQEELVSDAGATDLAGYLQNETSLQHEKTKQAEQMLAAGNSALQSGDTQQARRAFESAYGLSRNDAAFNEDARVQLNNLKLQQALVGLNVRQAAVAGEPQALGGKWRDLRDGKDVNYTQEDAKEILDRNTADENAAFMRLAQRLIQQQDAAVSSPAVIRANIPQQGRLLTFKRAVVVDTWADLNIGLKARATQVASSATRLLVLAVVAFTFLGLGLYSRTLARNASRA